MRLTGRKMRKVELRTELEMLRLHEKVDHGVKQQLDDLAALVRERLPDARESQRG